MYQILHHITLTGAANLMDRFGRMTEIISW